MSNKKKLYKQNSNLKWKIRFINSYLCRRIEILFLAYNILSLKKIAMAILQNINLDRLSTTLNKKIILIL